MQVLVGVDGGGSKTTALLADETGNILGRGMAGPSNYLTIGKEAAEAAVIWAIRKAFESAGKTFAPADAICLGLASVDEVEDPIWVFKWAESVSLGKEILIVDDQEIVMQAGTPSGTGLGLICGTGSVVFGRRIDGRRIISGGWGCLLSDEGSGFAIGLEALKSVTQMVDGCIQKTLLQDLVFNHWNLSNEVDLYRRLHDQECSSREVAEFASLVAAAESIGDPVAHQILWSAGEELALCLASVARQMDCESPFPCAMGGGVITNNHVVFDALMEGVKNREIGLDPICFVKEPAEGALVLARKLLSGEIVEWKGAYW